MLKEKRIEIGLNLLFVLMGSILVYAAFQFLYRQEFQHVIKFSFLAFMLAATLCLLLALSLRGAVCMVIFFALLDIPFASYHVSSTTMIVLLTVGFHLIRTLVTNKTDFSMACVKRNDVTLPLLLILLSYTLSFLFVEKGWGDHLFLYQGIFCGALIVLLIVGTAQTQAHIVRINRTLLLLLLLNLGFSFLFFVFPEVDAIRAKLFSLSVYSGEFSTRAQGLSFRGESYGEFLMICALFLSSILINGQPGGKKSVVFLVTLLTVFVLILTRLRGANALFLLGLILLVFSTTRIHLSRKVGIFLGIALFYLISLLASNLAGKEEGLLDRFKKFGEKTERIWLIPKTRYYTWVPALRYAEKNAFLGSGPSFKPYIRESEWRDVVQDDASGDITVWPHNIILLILCTVGIYGLASYAWLAYRAWRQRRYFPKMEPFIRHTYRSYLLCFFVFLLEAQKYDGCLRHPGATFYLACILVGLLFAGKNIAFHSSESEAWQEEAQ